MTDRVFKVVKAQLARVKNPLPIPTICPHCQSAVERVNNKVIYGRQFGDWPFAYKCVSAECDSYVGIHPKTDIPIGTLATATMRAARKQAKAAFAPLWEKQGMDKEAAYSWLADKMGIVPMEHCHIGWFGIEQCNRVIEICNTHLKGITK